MEKIHPNKIPKVSATLTIVRKISSKKIQKSKRQTIQALIPKEIFIHHIHTIHDIFPKQLALSSELYKSSSDFPKGYKILKQRDLVIHPHRLLKLYSKLQFKNSVHFKILSKFNENTYIVDTPNYWGISNSFNISDFVEFHKNEDIPNEMFSSP